MKKIVASTTLARVTLDALRRRARQRGIKLSELLRELCEEATNTRNQEEKTPTIGKQSPEADPQPPRKGST